MNGQEFRNEILKIKRDFYSNKISYDEAKRLAKPIIEKMNVAVAEICKKYNQKVFKYSFATLFR